MPTGTLRITLITICIVGLNAGPGVSDAARAGARGPRAGPRGAPNESGACDRGRADRVDSPIAFSYLDQPASPRRRRSRRRRRMPAYKAGPVEKGGRIVGTVTYRGALPEERKIRIVKDPEVCGRRKTAVPRIRVDDQGRVAEAVVYLADIRQGRAFGPRKKPPVINQHFCTFEPHVQAVRVKEDVEIVNSDAAAHNINATQRIYTLFNILQPQKEMRATRQFKKPGLVSLRCNVHDWMQGWVWVFRHPYYQVTGPDGVFELENVPAGTYELAVWQEHLGERFFPVEVRAGETTKLPVPLAEKREETK